MRLGCFVKGDELRAAGDDKASRAEPSLALTAPQPELQSRSGGSDQIQPRVQVTRQACSDKTDWAWGQAQDGWGSQPGADMPSTQIQEGAKARGRADNGVPKPRGSGSHWGTSQLLQLPDPRLLQSWPWVQAGTSLGKSVLPSLCTSPEVLTLLPRNKFVRTGDTTPTPVAEAVRSSELGPSQTEKG